MKRKIYSFLTLLYYVAISVFVLISCDQEKNVEPVCIRVENAVAENVTLLDYMNDLREAGELEFESVTGLYGEMIKSINGTANGVGIILAGCCILRTRRKAFPTFLIRTNTKDKRLARLGLA